MAEIYGSNELNKLRLELLKELDEKFQPFYQDISNYILGLFVKYENTNGTLDKYKLKDILAELDRYVTNKFVSSSTGNSANQNNILGNSEYYSLLLAGITVATKMGVAENQLIMIRLLADAPDVKQKLLQGTLNPRVADELPQGFTPLADYQPNHEWVDLYGKQLSDKIWNVAGETRRKLDLYVQEAVMSGKSARDMSDDLENFLLPGKALQRTNRPYGTDASFPGMRLARTEIASSQVRAAHASALMNPFVEQYQPVLSREHPEPDECDDMIAIGPYDKSDPSGLPPFHPQCLCRVRWLRNQPTSVVVNSLRESLKDLEPDKIPITPLRLDAFTHLLLGL